MTFNFFFNIICNTEQKTKILSHGYYDGYGNNKQIIDDSQVLTSQSVLWTNMCCKISDFIMKYNSVSRKWLADTDKTEKKRLFIIKATSSIQNISFNRIMYYCTLNIITLINIYVKWRQARCTIMVVISPDKIPI